MARVRKKHEVSTSDALRQLSDADREFVTRFVLCSGSLKAVAEAYGVSYPTIRAMLDDVMARLEALVAGKKVDPMSDLLGQLVDRGEITVPAARRVRKCHREQLDRLTE